MRFAMLIVSLVAGLCVAPARAQIQVVKGAGDKSSIDWTAFRAGGDAASQTFLKVLTADLIRSGWFVSGAPGQSELALTGTAQGDGASVKAQVWVYGRVAQRQYLAKSFGAPSANVRKLAHQVADEIVLAVTGRKGMASAMLAMVGNQTGHKEIYLADADGFNARAVTRDQSINLGPNWSRDGRRLVYTSYAKRFPDLYIHDLFAASRQVAAKYAGLNTGGAFSPDGRRLALILSKDGNPELYVKELGSGGLTRLTQTPRAAEASPSWSPDGNQIVYVSDAAGVGRPQLFMIGRQGGASRRLTSRGSQNVAPDWGPNNKIAFASVLGGRWGIHELDPVTLETRQISPGDADYEDPSWAPDGRHLAAARSVQYRSKVYLLDTMGDRPVALTDYAGDWYSPAWAPGQ